FHAFGLSILKKHYAECGRRRDFYIADDDDIYEILSRMLKSEKDINGAIRAIEAVKQGIRPGGDEAEPFDRYNEILKSMNAVDINDLIYLPVVLFNTSPGILD